MLLQFGQTNIPVPSCQLHRHRDRHEAGCCPVVSREVGCVRTRPITRPKYPETPAAKPRLSELNSAPQSLHIPIPATTPALNPVPAALAPPALAASRSTFSRTTRRSTRSHPFCSLPDPGLEEGRWRGAMNHVTETGTKGRKRIAWRHIDGITMGH